MIELKTGFELKGRYVIQDIIGHGGSGTVWKATDKQLGRHVAIKRLSKYEGVTQDNLLEEAKKSANLVHTNIVQIYDIQTEDKDTFLIMEYVGGSSLAQILKDMAKKNETFAPDRAIEIIESILLGISFAHRKNICHRDLSPMNILISETGTPKISDFGIALDLSSKTGTPIYQAGTCNPNFTSPEQANGESADFTSDLFMVGIIGYILLTGKHPFSHPSGLFSIIEFIKDSEYEPPPPPTPAGLMRPQQKAFREYASIIMKLLKKESTARYTSAVDVIDDIKSVTPSRECGECGENSPVHYNYCGFCGAKLGEGTSAGLSEEEIAEIRAKLKGLPVNEIVDEGFRLAKAKKWMDAIDVYKKAIKKDPSYQRAYANLGFALNYAGEYEEAIEILTKGLEIETGVSQHKVNFYHQRSLAYSNLKQYDKALEDLNKALEINPRFTKCLYQRARINLLIKQYEAALQDTMQVLDFVPDHSGANRLLEELSDLL